jgi:hypothetical protein
VTVQAEAEANFQRHIVDNPYPGRGIVVARAQHGEPRGEQSGFHFIYWIMGRSEHSQNRRFVADGGALRTEPVDVGKVQDPSLIIYEAMLELPGVQLVTNGDQTRTIHDALQSGGSFESALRTREREPDAPNYTPRISAMLDVRGGAPELALSILKANRFDPEQSDRFFYRPALPAPGFGLMLTTYMGDGSPLPSFEGEPRVMPCAGSADELLERYWDALDAGNRVSLAVKSISATGETVGLQIRNRFD